MMKIFFKSFIPGVLFVIHVLIWGALLSDFAFAGHSNQVLSVVESARQRGIPEDILEYLLAYSIDNSVAPDHVVTVIQILVNVKESGLKLAPFQDKIREGIAKHVSPERIEIGLNELWSDYLFARELLAEKSRSSSNKPKQRCNRLWKAWNLASVARNFGSFAKGLPPCRSKCLPSRRETRRT